MSFLTPKAPAVPPPPPPPPEPVVPEPVTRVADEEKRRMSRVRGRASTIRTGPRGLLGGASSSDTSMMK